MKLTTPTFTPLLLVALGLAGIVLPACAQDSGSFYRPLTLASADASSSAGGGAGAEDEQAKAAERYLTIMEIIRTFLEQQSLLSMFLVIALSYAIGSVNVRGFNLLQDLRQSMK